MRKVINLIIVAYIAVLTMSCSNSSVDNSLPAKERIQGQWKVVEAEGAFAEENIGTNYIFEGNVMKTSSDAGGFEITGAMQLSDTSVVWTLENMEMNYLYRFEDDKLVLELNSGQVLKLKKQ